MMDLASRIAKLPPEKRDLLLSRLSQELMESQPFNDRDTTPASGMIETQLRSIWAEILRLEQIGIDDNFFEIGGTSLLAARLLTRLHERMNVRLPLRSVFDAPTVLELARFVKQARDSRVRSPQEEQLVLQRARTRLEQF